jgi:cobyrinic acid a,c-diamide synthase
MPHLPRIALGTVQPAADPRAILWALLDRFAQRDVQCQLFHSRACFHDGDAAAAITGLSPRHLDNWLMSRRTCRELFERGSADADLSIVEGCLVNADEAASPGGNLSTLCDWLDLPRVVVVDVSALSGCDLPERPVGADAVLLDRLADRRDLFRMQTLLEAHWGLPVLGGLETLPELRRVVDRLSGDSQMAREIGRRLGDHLLGPRCCERLEELAASRPLAAQTPATVWRPHNERPMRVAVAFDEAFHCYFHDTLDLLELWGAVVTDFSPLCDEALPPQTDVVYVGCGHPERYAHELASNHCMMSALRRHLVAGRRVYAEGGGMAYLCRTLVPSSGEPFSMVGALPATATYRPIEAPPRPVEVTLSQLSWLGEGWSSVRGYLDASWQIERTGPLVSYAAQAGHELDLVGCYQVIASRLHLDFAAQPELLRRFTEPGLVPVDQPV